ncbi:MAG: hypothetical protein Q9207_000075 [Kuettlingeria erythrocarpa]
MSTFSFWPLDFKEQLKLTKPRVSLILHQVKHAEKKLFPRNEALDFDLELKKRNAALIAVLECVEEASSVPIVAAYALFVHTPPLALLHKICVLEKYRGRGIAAQMLSVHHQSLALRACGKVQLWVDEQRMAARHLYEKLGFKETDTSIDLEDMAALLIAWVAFAYGAVANPRIGLPINAQVPPVARTSQPFNFTFAATTFLSSADDMHYALTDAPRWLQLDQSSRTFSGSPAPTDTGSAHFQLVATDSSGSTAMPVTLLVSQSPGPGLGKPIKDQLSSQEAFQSPDTLLLLHSSALSLSFSPETFTHTSHDTVYYAICANNTPLPSWITFDPSSLSFSGTAPQSTSPDELPQTFDILFTASDVPGFSAAVASFRLILESHILTFGNQPQLVDITGGFPFTYGGLLPSLLSDGHAADRSDIREIHADKPDWVAFDESSWDMSGLPPSSVDTQTITVTATDVFGENATTTVILQVATNSTTKLFKRPLRPVNATIGADFDYVFDRDESIDPGTKLSVDLRPASPWLRWDEPRQELSGRVPTDLKPQTIVLNVTATQGLTSQSQPLAIRIESGSHTSNSRSTDAPNSSSSASSEPAASSPASSSSSQLPESGQAPHSRQSRLAAAIAVPIAVVCLLLIFASCLICRKRRRKTSWLSVSKGKISRPLLPDGGSDRESVGEMIEGPAAAQKFAPSRPPIIDFPGFRSSMASKRRSLFRLSKGTIEDAPPAFRRDSWEEYTQSLSIAKPKTAAQTQFSLVPEEQASSHTEGSRFSSRKHPSRSSRPSGTVLLLARRGTAHRHRRSDLSFGSVGLLSNRRVSGFGHGFGHSPNASSFESFRWRSRTGVGHGNGGPTCVGRVRDSWRNPSINRSSGSWTQTQSSIKDSDHDGSERSHSVATAMRFFPQPPTNGTLCWTSQPQTIYEGGNEKKSTIRAVPREGLQAHERPLHDFHKDRARNRHHRNTFFSARPSSHASAALNWVPPIQPSVLSTSPSMRSLGAQRYPQKSSPLRPSPPKSRLSSRGLANIISNGITNRFQSSRSSMASSQRCASAAEESELGLGSAVGLEEGKDEEGNRRWRHVDASRDSPTTAGAGASEMLESSGLGSMLRQSDEMSRRVQRRNLPTEQDPGGREGEGPGGRRFVVGSRGKRPVSVDNGLMARGASVRGVVDEGEVAFL